MKTKYFLFLTLLFLSGCGRIYMYGDYGTKDGCNDYYWLSGKNYKTMLTENEVVNSWEHDGYKILRDTIYGRKGGYAPLIKILNYQHKEIDMKINYIGFQVLEFRKTEIKLHGICLKEKLKYELPFEEFKRIDEIIRKEFVDKFRL